MLTENISTLVDLISFYTLNWGILKSNFSTRHSFFSFFRWFINSFKKSTKLNTDSTVNVIREETKSKQTQHNFWRETFILDAEGFIRKSQHKFNFFSTRWGREPKKKPRMKMLDTLYRVSISWIANVCKWKRKCIVRIHGIIYSHVALDMNTFWNIDCGSSRGRVEKKKVYRK